MQRVDPFPASDFDQWAESYDDDVVAYDRFPFAGYQQVLKTVLQRGRATRRDDGAGHRHRHGQPGARVPGGGVPSVGHGLLSSHAGQGAAEDAGGDARAARPARQLASPNWIAASTELSPAYALHHFELERKVSMLAEMGRDHLEVGGRIVIADISFRYVARHAGVCVERIAICGKQEPYWVADEAQSALREAGLKCAYRTGVRVRRSVSD